MWVCASLLKSNNLLAFLPRFWYYPGAGYLCGVGADATFERTDALTQGSKDLADRKSPLDGTFGRGQQLPTLMYRVLFKNIRTAQVEVYLAYKRLVFGRAFFFNLNFLTIDDIRFNCTQFT